jgi:hypothetical protein
VRACVVLESISIAYLLDLQRSVMAGGRVAIDARLDDS